MGEYYREHGYFVAPRLLDRETVQSLKDEIRQVLKGVTEEKAARGEPGDAAANGVFVGLAARSAAFRELAADPRLVDPLEQMIGPNVEFLSDKVVLKNRETDFGSPWHQDWPYWKGSHKLSVWIALDEAKEANGCLRVIPGSHRTKLVHDGDASDGKGFGNRLRPESIDEGRAVTVELEPGGAIFFHDLTLHASHANRSGGDRWALISTYRDAQADDPEYGFAKAAFVVRGRAS